MSSVFDFPSIARKLNRLEQKAEADKKAAPVNVGQAWPFAVAVPYPASVTPPGWDEFRARMKSQLFKI